MKTDIVQRIMKGVWMNQEKVLIIGLDGVTFDLIEPWVAERKLPNLEKLMQNGTKGILKSTIMPNSFPGWTSCTTGVNPGKHSIYMPMIRRDRNSYSMFVPTARDIKVKTIWQILSENDRRVGVINVPCTYPPSEVNGFLVSGMLSPGLHSNFTYPEALKDEMITEIRDYVIDVKITADTTKKRLLEEILYSIKKRQETTLYLMEKYDWDFFMTVFTESDRAQHYFWADMDAEHYLHNKGDAKLYGDAIQKVYQRLDEAVGTILDRTDDNTKIMIVSDHGFGRDYKSVVVNKWLIDKGLLFLNEGTRGKESKHKKEQYKKFLQKLGLLGLAKKIYHLIHTQNALNVSKWQLKELKGQTEVSMIDWSRTKAYVAADRGIRINLKGREPDGIVNHSDYKKIINYIKEELIKLNYPDGNRVFEEILAKEEVFTGPYLEYAPDLITVMKVSYPVSDIDTECMFKHGGWTTGSHTANGIFIAVGAGIKKDTTVTGANLMDICPTALYMLGIPLTKEMDGKVLMEIFEDGYSNGREIKYYGSSYKCPPEEKVFDEQDEQKVKERLKGLGYI